MLSLIRSLCVLALATSVANCSSSNFAGGTGGTKSGKGGKGGDKPDADENNKDDKDDGPRNDDGGDPGAVEGEDSDDETHLDETTGIKTDPSGLIAEDADEAKNLVPQFGLLANDLVCGVCHVAVNGDVISTSATVPEPHTGGRNAAKVNGAWFAAQDYAMSDDAVKVRDGVQKNYRGKEMPKDLDGNGIPDFPRIDFDKISGKMKGSAKSTKDSVTKVADGNVVLIGTESDPIEIKGEMLIKGDLVITGYYKGIGTIYVQGNAYIPADLRAKSSPFPYSADKSAALSEARQAVKDRQDALAIASRRAVIIGNFEPIGGIHSVFDRDDTPAEMRAGPLGTSGILSWYPGGEEGVKSLFKSSAKPCGTLTGIGRAIGEIDAYLYAEKAVAGHSTGSSYSINGGVIADFFHIISAAEGCDDVAHPVHGQPSNYSYVNYDYRMSEGLLLLKQLAPAFNKK